MTLLRAHGTTRRCSGGRYAFGGRGTAGCLVGRYEPYLVGLLHQQMVQAEQVISELVLLVVLSLDCVIEVLYMALTYLCHVGLRAVPEDVFLIFNRVIT